MSDTKSLVREPHDYGTTRAFSSLVDIRDKKVTVMGLGLHGGGEASVRFFLRHGAYVTVTDMKTAEELAPSVASLTNDPNLNIERLQFVLGKHDIADFESADCVIKNPGVKYEGNRYLAVARYIETDMSIFLQFTQSPIIAITGSKGKSSTVSAIHYGLNKAGKNTLLGGNITLSPLTFFDQTVCGATGDTCEDLPIVVLELSSWQLADLRGRKLLKPKIALITKIVPDHQNWYGGMESYVADKKLLYADQTGADISIFATTEVSLVGKESAGMGQCVATELPLLTEHSDYAVQDWGEIFARETKACVFRYPDDIPNGLKLGCGKTAAWLDNLAVPGMHNKENILNAAFVMQLMGVDDEQTIAILQDYSGIAHRLEFFHTWKTAHATCRLYNDSAATVPEATAAALMSFKGGLHLISGGTDKNLDFTPFVKALESAKEGQLVSLFLLAGTGTDKLIAMLNESVDPVRWHGPYDNLETLLLELQDFILKNKNAGEQAIVFSPGATSFGMFKNEFDRGNTFKDLATKIFK